MERDRRVLIPGLRVLKFRLVSKLLGAIVIFLLSGCVAARFSLPLSDSLSLLPPSELSNIRAQLLNRWREVDQVRVLMRGHLALSDDRQSLKAALVWSAPDRLRLETFPAIGAYSLSLIAAKGAQATFIDFPSKSALLGDDQETIGEILGVKVPRQELVGMLLGRVPESALNRNDLEGYRDSSNGQFVLLWNGRTRWARINPLTGLVAELAYGDSIDGALVLAVTNKSIFEAKGVSFPGEVDLRAPARDFGLKLTTAAANFASSLPDSLFSVTIPADFTVH